MSESPPVYTRLALIVACVVGLVIGAAAAGGTVWALWQQDRRQVEEALAAAKDITGQVFYSRKNELMLFSQMRPCQRIHNSAGWTPQSIAEHLVPAFKTSFYPLDLTRNVFPSWLP